MKRVLMQARSSEYRKDATKNRHMRERRDPLSSMTSSLRQIVLKHVLFHESETFNVGDDTLRERMERSVIDHDDFESWEIMNEADMDFRIPGLPQSVVKHAQRTSVRELIQKIENHALQQDLRQIQAYYLFNPESKKMIQDVGNIESFELLETDPKKVNSMPIILEFWHRRLHVRAFLAERNSGQSKVRSTYNGPSFTSRICHQEGQTPCTLIWEKARRQRILLAHQLKKKCKMKRFHGIHDRFLHDQEFRIRMVENHRDEEVCRRLDVLADEDHTYHPSLKEYYYKNKWWLHLNKSGSETWPLRKRSDFKQALSTLERLHQGVGEEPFVPIYSYKYKQWQSASSSSSTWWNCQDSWWSSQNSESQGRGKQSLGNERRDVLLPLLCRKLPTMAFKNSIYFVTDKSFTAESGLL